MERDRLLLLVTLFVLCPVLTVNAARVTARSNRAPLEKWLKTVEDRTGVQFDVDDNVTEARALIMDARDVPLDQFMYGVLRPRGLSAVKGADDPWVQSWAGRIATGEIGSTSTLEASSQLLKADRGSHRVPGASAVAGAFMVGQVGVELPEGQNLRKSRWPLIRLVAWAAISPEDADKKLRAKIKQMVESGPDCRRFGALLSLWRLPAGEGMAGFENFLSASLASPIDLERYVAAQAITRAAPFTEILSVLKEQMASGNKPGARLLVRALSMKPLWREQEKRAQRLMDLTRLVVTEGGGDLQVYYLSLYIHRLNRVESSAKLARLVLEELSPAVLLEWTESSNASADLAKRALPTLAKRLKAEFEEGNTRTQTQMLGAVKEIFTSGRFRQDQLADEAKKRTFHLLGKVAEQTLLREDGNRRLGMKLLAGLYRSGHPSTTYWYALPDVLLKAAETGVKAVKSSDRRTAEYAAQILGSLYRSYEGWERINAGRRTRLEQAMENAKAWVEKNGTPVQKVHVWMGLEGQEEYAGMARRKLQNYIAEGKVPENLRETVSRMLFNHSQDLQPEFVKYCLDKLEDDATERRRRLRLIGLLSATVRRIKRGNQGEPDWFEEVAETAWRIGTDPDDTVSNHAIRLYGRTAAEGERAERLREFILDDEGKVSARVRAVVMLPRFDPDTTLYREMAEKYKKVPKRLAYHAAVAAGRSRKAPEAEDLVIKALKDQDLKDRYKQRICLRLNLPPSEELRAAVEKLEDNEVVKGAVNRLLRHWDRGMQVKVRRKREDREWRRKKAEKFREGLKTLKKEAEWTKKDPIDENVTWFGLEGGGVAFADSGQQEIEKPRKLLGQDDVRIEDIAFGEEKVWLAANIGLVAWDREMEFWSLLPTGTTVGDPVKTVEIKREQLHVRVQPEGKEESVWVRDADGKWEKGEEASRP